MLTRLVVIFLIAIFSVWLIFFNPGLVRIRAGTAPLYLDTVSSVGTATSQVTIGTVQGGQDLLYVATVANFQNREVSSVSGLGLQWSRAKAQCSGRGTTGIDLWTAFGLASSGSVTVTFAATTGAATLSVSRYAGVNSVNPISRPGGENTNGPNGACSGGVDNNQARLSLDSQAGNSALFVASNVRTRTISVPDPDYTQRSVVVAGSSGSMTRVYVHDRILSIAGADTVNHTTSGSTGTDWVTAGLVINPNGEVISTPTPTGSPSPAPTLEPTSTPTITLTPTPSPTPTPTSDTDAVLVGAGDIADCASSGDEKTAALLDVIAGTVFTAGDNVYESGSDSQFANCYHPSWGRHKERTKPVLGNHEYKTSGAGGYFRYFGAVAGEPPKGYYSYNIGQWHAVVINSECSKAGGCKPGSPQEQWLRSDLAANPKLCSIAFWHRPLFTAGPHTVSDTFASGIRPIWQALYDNNVDVIVNGHDHNYQRFAPQNPFGALDLERGIREFIVGTGGKNIIATRYPAANLEVNNNDTFGVLKLSLHPTSYDWEFVPVAGKTFMDSGSSLCH